MPEIRATVFAEMIGCTPRAVTAALNKKGMPGRKVKAVWMVEPSAAEAWCRANAPTMIKVEPGPGPASSGTPPTAPALPMDDEDHIPVDQADALNRAIGRLSQILDGLIHTLHSGNFDARVVTSIKQISTELRQLELHRMAMREADERLMDRQEHLRVVDMIGRAVAIEIESLRHALPKAVVQQLVEAKIELPESKRAMRAITAAAETSATELRARLAKRIRKTNTEGATTDPEKPR